MTPGSDVDPRAHALEQIVSLAREHQLTSGEIRAALGDDASQAQLTADTTDASHTDPKPDATESGARTVIVRVLGYLGGTFVFAGIAAFIALQWDAMNSAARVIITLGPGISACVLATLASRDARFEKAVPALFLIAAVLEPTGMLVAFGEFGSGGDARWAAFVTAGVVAAQFTAIFAVLRQSMLLFLAVFFGTLAWWTLFDLLGMDDSTGALVLGASLLLAAIGTDRTPHSAITPAWYLFGAAGFLYGLFDLVERTPAEVLFILAASGLVYLSALIQSRTLLLVATAAILGYTGWFTGQHFADSLGWPLALVLFGLSMIALSALAFRIDRQYIRSR
jgi:hypothetical protein